MKKPYLHDFEISGNVFQQGELSLEVNLLLLYPPPTTCFLSYNTKGEIIVVAVTAFEIAESIEITKFPLVLIQQSGQNNGFIQSI